MQIPQNGLFYMEKSNQNRWFGGTRVVGNLHMFQYSNLKSHDLDDDWGTPHDLRKLPCGLRTQGCSFEAKPARLWPPVWGTSDFWRVRLPMSCHGDVFHHKLGILSKIFWWKPHSSKVQNHGNALDSPRSLSAFGAFQNAGNLRSRVWGAGNWAGEFSFSWILFVWGLSLLNLNLALHSFEHVRALGILNRLQQQKGGCKPFLFL